MVVFEAPNRRLLGRYNNTCAQTIQNAVHVRLPMSSLSLSLAVCYVLCEKGLLPPSANEYPNNSVSIYPYMYRFFSKNRRKYITCVKEIMTTQTASARFHRITCEKVSSVTCRCTASLARM